MKILRFTLIAVVAITMAGAATTLYAAQCNGFPQPVFQSTGGFFTQCADTNPLRGYLYSLNTPSENSLGFDFTCNAGDAAGTIKNGQLNPCQAEAGSAGDGKVTVYWDYGNAGSTSCPNPSALVGTGRQIIQLIDNNGASLNICLGVEPSSTTYPVEYAMEDDGGGAGGTLPLACNYNSAPELISNTPVDATHNTVCVKLRQPEVFTDCDPPGSHGALYAGSVGFVAAAGADCEPGALAACQGLPGNLYTRTDTCGSSPDPRRAVSTCTAAAGTGTTAACGQGGPGRCADLRTCTTNSNCVGSLCSVAANCGTGGACTSATNWALQPTVPGPPLSGSVCFTATRPPSGCTFVGATAIFGSTESSAMVGSWQLAQAAASSPKANIDRAALAKGTVSVAFHTTTEVGAIGFNVLANGKALNTSLIAAGTDSGGHAYNFTARHDALNRAGVKGKGKDLSIDIVVQTMTNAGPINSDPVKMQRSK